MLQRTYGATDEEIKQFLSPWGSLTIEEHSITVYNYPFKPSIAFGEKTFAAKDIKSIDSSATPPTLHIGSELIFVSAREMDQLVDFSARNNIPVINQSLVWDWILSPYLDTTFTDEEHKRFIQRLSNHGVSPTTVSDIREKVGHQMMKYNFDTGLWNWTDFCALDVLLSMCPALSEEAFAIFYVEVMQIALSTPTQQS